MRLVCCDHMNTWGNRQINFTTQQPALFGSNRASLWIYKMLILYPNTLIHFIAVSRISSTHKAKEFPRNDPGHCKRVTESYVQTITYQRTEAYFSGKLWKYVATQSDHYDTPPKAQVWSLNLQPTSHSVPISMTMRLAFSKASSYCSWSRTVTATPWCYLGSLPNKW